MHLSFTFFPIISPFLSDLALPKSQFSSQLYNINIKMRLQNEEGFNLQDIQTFKNYKEKHFGNHKKCPTALAWNTSGSLLITAENSIKVWAFSEQHGLQKASELKGHDNNVDWAEFSSPNMLGTLSRQVLKFWDVRENGKMSCLKSQKRNKHDFIRFAWNNANSLEAMRLAVINKDNSVLLYDFRNTAAPLTTISTKSNTSLEYTAAAWDRSNSVLFLAGGQSNNGSLSLFSAENYESLAEPIITHCARITDICFTKDNQKFATVSEDSLLQIHTIPDIICQRVFNNKSDAAYRRVSFSHNGKYAAVSSQANSIDIFNAEKGGQACKIKASTSQEVLGWHPKHMLLAYIDEEDKRRSLDNREENYLHLFYQ